MKKITLFFLAFLTITWGYSQCTGTSSATQQGTFTYDYIFATNGTDVTITFKVIETFPGLVGQLKQGTNYTDMTNTGNQTFVVTLAGQTPGAVLSFEFFGPYEAGGVLLSAVYNYTVGDNCVVTGEDVSLSDLQLDGATIAGFSSTNTTYDIKLPDASIIPQVTLVTTTNPNAAVGAITQALAIPGSATFDVTSEDTNIVQTYTINFSVQVPLTELIGNGGFEMGDFTDWDLVPTSAGQTITTTNPSEGTYAANINNTVTETSLGIKSSNRGIGIVNPGDQVTVKFDARGSFGTGGVLFAELFSEFSGGGATNNILGGGPLALNPDATVWKSFEFTVNLGTDVGGGISLLFNALTGAGTSANVFIDNVSVVNNDQVLSTKVFEIAGLNVYPNPTQDSWTVKTKNIKMTSIQVFDILGKQVLSLAPNASEAKIDASQLKSGLYFAKINTANGSSSLKLVRQ